MPKEDVVIPRLDEVIGQFGSGEADKGLENLRKLSEYGLVNREIRNELARAVRRGNYPIHEAREHARAIQIHYLSSQAVRNRTSVWIESRKDMFERLAKVAGVILLAAEIIAVLGMAYYIKRYGEAVVGYHKKQIYKNIGDK